MSFLEQQAESGWSHRPPHATTLAQPASVLDGSPQPSLNTGVTSNVLGGCDTRPVSYLSAFHDGPSRERHGLDLSANGDLFGVRVR